MSKAYDWFVKKEKVASPYWKQSETNFGLSGLLGVLYSCIAACLIASNLTENVASPTFLVRNSASVSDRPMCSTVEYINKHCIFGNFSRLPTISNTFFFEDLEVWAGWSTPRVAHGSGMEVHLPVQAVG